MSPRLVLALVKRGGVALLAAVALGWWTYHLDGVTRAERGATESAFRGDRKEAEERFRSEREADRATWTVALRQIADACLRSPMGARK